MRVDVIDTIDSLAQVRDNWERVYRADPEAHYFLSWTWIANWFEPRPGRWLVLAAKPDDAAGDYVAFFPLRFDSQLDEEGNFRHSIRMGGSYFAAYTGILCDPENQTSTLHAFGEHIRSLNWAHFHIDDVFVSESRLRTLLQSFPPSNFVVKKKDRPSHVTDTGEDIDHDVYVFVKLPEDWDEFLATNLGRSTRRNARKYLKEVDASPEYRVSVPDAQTIDRDLEAILQLWQIQWEPKHPAQAQYILSNARHMIRRCFDDGTLFMPVLWKGENPIGANIAFADWEKRILYSFLGTRDLGIKKPPPGFLLDVFAIRWAIANGFTTYDLGTGNFAYKYSFGGEERIVESWLVSTRSGTNLHAPLDRRYLPLAMKQTQVHHAAGNLFRAGQGCRTILAFDPGIGTARTLLESIESDPTALIANAHTLFKRNKFAEAQRVCEEILVRDPENFEAHHVLGATLVMRGLAKEAEGHIRHTIERRPDFASAHNNLGLALAALECMPEALASYDQALAVRPDYARAFYNRGEVLRKMGRLGEAIESFESAVAIRPDYGKAIASLRGLIELLPMRWTGSRVI